MNSRYKLIFSSSVFLVLILNEYLFEICIPTYAVFALTFIAYLVCGLDVVVDAIKILIKQKRMTEQLLMTIATFAAFSLKDFPEALAIMVFYKIGDSFEDYAKTRSHNNIMHLASVRPQFARVINEGEQKILKPKDVKIGDIITVLKGEIVPIDGILLSDSCALTLFPSLLVTGPFSIVLGYNGGLMALNDRLKLRSMVVGEKNNKVYIASEEAAIRVMEPNVENVWAPAGGEPVIVNVKEGCF